MDKPKTSLPWPTGWSASVTGTRSVLAGALGYSRARASNWLWVPRLDLIVDAGEGCSTALAAAVGSPRRVLITHGHGDHILGLAGLIAARQFTSLVSGGPLEVVYPEGCPGVLAIREFLPLLWPGAFDRIQWTALSAGARLPAGKSREIVAFQTAHSARFPSLGYAVVEERRRLREAFQGRSEGEIAALAARLGRAEITETYSHTLFAHTGDARRISDPLFEGADTVVFDATFVASIDRDDDTHASAEEVMVVARERRVRQVVLHHLSQRYDRSKMLRSLRSLVADFPDIDMLLFDEERLVRIRGG